ncbi:hypothetical protein L1987_27473 [Smallanthus sonchifolius]|uniref:Uncharacterized protein n=1 Tax=Smallanthus sonchifolius TaxID=185202 RepID=A0ACB9IBA1_9ASTR|nr:hypothetical protein L1987_27473 [Smallanthus sonchifolius]
MDEPFVEDCTTSLESESTCSDHDETSAAPSEAVPNKVEVPAVTQAIPAPVPFKQIKISYPPDGRKLNIEKGETSGPTNPKPQSKSITKRKVFDICLMPEEKVPYVQKTLEEATFEHNKAHPWNFKDLFQRKDYVYLSRDKLARSCFMCGRYNHTASTCFHYLEYQRNLKQHGFEKTNKNKKVRSCEVKATKFRESLSPPRVKLPKSQQTCIICGESDHFAANSARKNVGSQMKPKKTKQKLSAATKSAADKLKSSAAKSAADKEKSKAKPSAAKNVATSAKLSAAGSTVDKPETSVAKSAADNVRKTRKSPTKQWKAKPSPSIIIGSIDCKHTEKDKLTTIFFKHMTGNRSILSNFRHFNGGYVAFGSDSKGGSITRQGTVSNERMSIDKVNYVKELDFNLMSVSQRKENLYVLDMNEVTPSRSVSCFLSKASVDESALWHRRLSHVNIKTINKLVKNNLVRGLPDKEFQLEDHCIA